MRASGQRTISRLVVALLVAQAAHSVEEYVFHLYDMLPPARFVSGLVSDDRAFGFAVVNAALVLFFAWTWWARVRPGRPSGRRWAWFWALLEGWNGVLHLAIAAVRGGYFPGAATAPFLLGLAVRLGLALRTAPAAR